MHPASPKKRKSRDVVEDSQEEPTPASFEVQEEEPQQPKRGRGRPRKDTSTLKDSSAAKKQTSHPAKKPRKRGVRDKIPAESTRKLRAKAPQRQQQASDDIDLDADDEDDPPFDDETDREEFPTTNLTMISWRRIIGP